MTSPTTTTPNSAQRLGAHAVDLFLDAISAGRGVPADVLSTSAVLDATVPGWRFAVRGAEAVARQYSGWFTSPGEFEELERLEVGGGEVVCYLLSWTERGVPHAAHHCHVFRFDPDGRIAADRFFCGGRWDAGLPAEMAAASDAG